MAMQEDYLSLKALASARAYLYMLFHKVFGGKPTTELLEHATSAACLDAIEEFARPGNGLEELALFLEGIDTSDTEYLSDAEREYNRLFVGFGRPSLPLWEAAYLSGDDTLFGKGTLAVRACYRSEGLRTRKGPGVPDDHASLMAAFLGQSAEKTYGVLSERDFPAAADRIAKERAFVTAHLCSWLPQAVASMDEGGTERLYPPLLGAFASFVQADAIFLAEAAAWIGELGEDEVIEEASCEEFDRMARALEELKTLRLPVLEENELVEA